MIHRPYANWRAAKELGNYISQNVLINPPYWIGKNGKSTYRAIQKGIWLSMLYIQDICDGFRIGFDYMDHRTKRAGPI